MDYFADDNEVYYDTRHKSSTGLRRYYYKDIRPTNLDIRHPLEWELGTPKDVPQSEVEKSDKRVARRRAKAVAIGLAIGAVVDFGVLWGASEVWQHVQQEKAKGQIHDGTRTEADGIPPIDNPLSEPTVLGFAGALAVTFGVVGGVYSYKQESIDIQVRRSTDVAQVE